MTCSPTAEPTQRVSLIKTRCPVCGGAPHRHTPVPERDCLLPHRYDQRTHPPARRIGWCCRGCVQRHRDQLNQILELWALLPSVVPLGSVPDDTAEHTRVKKQPASPAMMRVHAWAMLYGRLRSSVPVWDEHGRPAVEDGTPVRLPARLGGHLPDVPRVLCQWSLDATGTNPRTVSSAVIVLRKLAEDIAAQPWIDEYDAELGWILRALRDAHGIENVAPLGPCISVRDGRDCGGKVREQPGDNPRCDRCGRRYGTHDLVRMMQMSQGKRGRGPRPRRRLFSAKEGQGRA